MKIRSYILPVVAGTMTGMILQVVGEKIIHSIYPVPEGARLDNKEELAAYITTLPTSAFLLLLMNNIVCTMIAGALATLIAQDGSKRPAIVVGLIITLGGVFNIMLMPFQPIWVSTASILLFIPAALMGHMIAVRARGNLNRVG
jgi:hypothetical protein